jgi:hypothetical protein
MRARAHIDRPSQPRALSHQKRERDGVRVFSCADVERAPSPSRFVGPSLSPLSRGEGEDRGEERFVHGAAP